MQMLPLGFTGSFHEKCCVSCPRKGLEQHRYFRLPSVIETFYFGIKWTCNFLSGGSSGNQRYAKLGCTKADAPWVAVSLPEAHYTFSGSEFDEAGGNLYSVVINPVTDLTSFFLPEDGRWRVSPGATEKSHGATWSCDLVTWTNDHLRRHCNTQTTWYVNSLSPSSWCGVICLLKWTWSYD